MLLSRYHVFKRLVLNGTTSRWHVCRYENTHSPLTKLFQKIDLSDPLPQYSNIEELKSANERVKKVLSMEFASNSECISYLIKKFIQQINPSSICYNEVHEIVTLHFTIKQMQEDFKPELRRSHLFGHRIKEKKQERAVLLDHLRDHQFETYVKLITVLDLQHYFEPQYIVERTEIADEVEDMRIRSFAESKRLAALKKERKSKLSSLKNKYAHEMLTGEMAS